MYLVKIPWWVKALYPALVWNMPAEEKAIYLSFDDGPHETATPFVLDVLRQYHAKATFFCIGKNVAAHPGIYNRILLEGHRTGNHTNDHMNGWKTADQTYLQNITRAAAYIDSDLFRPPYGRITRLQAKLLTGSNGLQGMVAGSKKNNGAGIALPARPFKVIMWSVLSGDFDTKLSPGKCLQQVIMRTRPGDIVVFHDSTKAWDRMQYALPRMLEYFSAKGYSFKALP